MRMATAGAPQNRRPVGKWSQNRARLGASAGGTLPSSSRSSAPPPPGQSDPIVPNFRQRIALRRDWIYCDKCGQWGKHKGMSAVILRRRSTLFVDKIQGILLQLVYVTASMITRCILCLLYTSPSPRDRQKSRMPSSA